ncbi:alkylation response protein AidB-like acyl-CoA dehydrogenase [Nocardioides zeae]|uniref:Alkylation response protein AidB-like acyl-CoA dehydrogenase n=1 Tax=Nocardioides zeae TaxID=1457234 RepID=A0ACC6ILG4_9ACTN|nr:acyl-CoA dehydrogenase family protein [Nocardioides zeae]MDR6175033.1 alkylation response protein AidB-like acyl-CoA dehydrogenase [Nocardioides zeae]MDR6211611.1 alkylation response protein AidB-like acyl-CoA dehydrogenase [Nocardioides zeae]
MTAVQDAPTQPHAVPGGPGGPGAPDASDLTVAGVRAAVAPVLQRLAATSAAREAARDFAFDDVRALGAAGVGLLVVSRDEGGAGGSLRDAVDLVIEVARADSSVAQALRSTFLASVQVASRPDLPHRDRALARLLSRGLQAGTGNERSGGASGSVSTTAERVEGGWVVTGEKYYSTGGLYASWFSAQAQAADGTLVRFTVPTDREGVELVDDFDAVGQRLTASGTTRLHGVRVSDDEAVVGGEAVPDNPWQGSFAQLYLAAVQAGVAARALDDAVWWVRERARPTKHSSATTSAEDPYVRQTVGEIAARAQAARAVVLLAAEELQATWGLTGDEARAAGSAAAVHVAQAGVVAIESALKAAELLFDTGGGSITDRALGLDRHWRNARTAANHNPRQWKQAVAGAWHVAGEEPPTTGLF